MPRYEDEDFVNVPVPKSRVEEVYQLLGMPQRKNEPDGTKSLRENGKSKWWPQDRIVLLKQEITNSTILTLLDLAAERSPAPVGFDEICRETGSTEGKVRADLGKLTSLIKRLFKDNERAWWPVEIKATVPATYSMPQDIARLWERA